MTDLAPRKTCAVCGKLFYAPPVLVRRGGGRFCSVKCRAAAQSSVNKEKQIKKACLHCGKTFSVPPCRVNRTKYCSGDCYRSALHEKVVTSEKSNRRCEYCGGPIDGHGARFCSMQCNFDYRAEHKKPSKTIVRWCETCGKEFLARAYEVEKGQARFCSHRCFGAGKVRMNAENGYSRCRGGKREDLENRYFRSRWEANYARYLNWLVSAGEILSWEYEADTFEFARIKRGNRFYTPDFKIHNTDGTIEYHEVKGWMDATSKTKLARMTRYYPLVKIVVVDQPAYRAIAMQVRNLVPGWERDDKHTY